ncbi:unnamed protein product [Bathycoccus prasinos]
MWRVLLETVLATGIFFGLYGAADAFLRKVLCRDASDKVPAFVAFLFSLTFASSFSMVLLVLGEVSDTFTETFLTVASLFSIWTTISMVIVVVPFFHFYKLFSMVVPGSYGLEKLSNASGRMMQLNQAVIRRAKSKRRRKVILVSVCAHLVSLVFFLEFGALDGDPIYSKGSIFSKVDGGGSGGSGSSGSNSNNGGGAKSNIFTVSRLIARAGVVGVIVLGVLSGFGAIHYPYTTMSLFARPVSDAEIERDEERLVKALETAVERKKRLVLLERELFPRSANERRQQRTRASMYFNIPIEEDETTNKKNNNNISNNPYENDAVNRNNAKNNIHKSRTAANNFLKDVVTSSANEKSASQLLASSKDQGEQSLLSKLASSAMQFVFSGRNGGAMTSEQKLQNAKFEVVALDRVVRSLFLELKERRALKKRAVESRTTFGRAKNTSGVLMSVCCAVKLLSVFGQIVLGKSKNVDVVTKTLRLLLLSHSVNVTAEQLSQYLSLAFIAFLVGSSTRNFLYFLSRAFDALGTIASSVSGSSNVSETTTSLVLFCTEIVGLYFLSSVLLVREQLPSQYRDGKTFSLFGGDMHDLSDTFFGMEEGEAGASAESKPEKTFYQSWYDLIFFVSSFASLLVLFAFHKFNAVNAASAKEEREMFFYSSPANGGGGLGGDPLSGIVIAGGGERGAGGSGGERGASVVKAI